MTFITTYLGARRRWELDVGLRKRGDGGDGVTVHNSGAATSVRQGNGSVARTPGRQKGPKGRLGMTNRLKLTVN
jgi:hypothetical protein